MNFNPHTFLYDVKQAITGGGKYIATTSTYASDGGFFVDKQISLGDVALGSATLTKDAAGIPILNTAASSNNVGSTAFAIPRDYDQNTDIFKIRILADMNGTTDAPILILSPVALALGSSTGSTLPVGNPVTGTSSTVSNVTQAFEYDLSGNKFLRDTIVAATISTGAHTTNALQIYAIEATYASCLVAYTPITSTGNPAPGNDALGNPLRGY